MMTWTQGLNAEEENAIEELQVRMKGSLPPKLYEDSSLFYRFLKARDFDVDKAEKMLKKHITWRKINQVDTILDDIKPKEFYFKYAFPSVIGLDKDGDLVIYSAAGKIETSDALKCEKLNVYKKYWIWFAERNLVLLKDYSQKTGKECKQTSYIIDLDKLTFSNVTHKASANIWLEITYIFQDNYPERMKAVYVINAPSYYVIVFTILKAVLSNAMLQKIHVFGQRNGSLKKKSNFLNVFFINGWKEKLLDNIDADVLPAFLGGNRTDPDGNPLCLTFVRHSGKFSSEYYLSDKDRYFKDSSQVETIVIPLMDRKEVYIDVTEKGSIIKWEYLVKSKDIGFGLSFQNAEQNIEEIIPIEKYSTVDGTESGSYKSHSIGKYIIIFDNSHSWLSSKEIEYCLTVIKPE